MNNNINIFLFSNDNAISIKTKKILNQKLISNNLNVVNCVKNSNLIIVIGGDGTMLSAIRKYKFLNIPFIGVNTGNLGFLTGYSPDNIENLINDLIHKKYVKEKHFLLKVHAHTNQNKILTSYAFNEIIIKHIQPSLMSAKININNNFFNKYSGDGLVISTPIGSTGYAIWLGASAIHSLLNVFQITPVAPNDSSINRPFNHSIIVPDNTVLDIEILNSKKSKIIVASDGKNICNMNNFDCNNFISNLKILKSDYFVELLKPIDDDFFIHYKNKIIDKISK